MQGIRTGANIVFERWFGLHVVRHLPFPWKLTKVVLTTFARVRVVLSFMLLFGVTTVALAQPSVRTHISFEYGLQFPGGDMAERFGLNMNLGGQFEVMLNESLWHAGVKGLFLFGNRVEEDVLSNLRTSDGGIIGNDRALADIALRERGMFVGGYVGKVFALSENQKSSGIKVSLGGGLLQHKIRVQDNTQSVNQIQDEYTSGYDRRTNGPALYGFVGYQRLDKNRRLNFLIGVDYTLGFTENRRAYDFNTMSRDDRSRIDGLFGFRIGWILPISYGENPGTIFY